MSLAKLDRCSYEKYGIYGAPPPPVAGSLESTRPFDEMSCAADVPEEPVQHIAPSADESILAEAPLASASSVSRKTGRRVLVVDDVSSNRKLVIRLLLRSGVESCEQAADGQEALAAYKKARMAQCLNNTRNSFESVSSSVTVDEPFDAILMDCEMPVMNGPTATKQLREMGCRAPIVGISGNVMPADVQMFMLHGADAVLPKPLVFAELEKIWKGYEK